MSDLDAYDAGNLSDYGGGNVEWWHDYIRAELARAHEFYSSQIAHQAAEVQKPLAWAKPHGAITLHRCETPFGTYRTWTTQDAGGKWFWSLEMLASERCGEGTSEGAVRLAAEADYMIRSASVFAPYISTSPTSSES